MSNFCYKYLCQPFGSSFFGERRNPSYNIQRWFSQKEGFLNLLANLKT
jgi:hypothetical protein